MKNGIYHVKFASSLGSQGEGLVVIRQGTVNGGDHGYLYRGEFMELGGQITGKLGIQRWNRGATSVFGNADRFELSLTGSPQSSDSFRVEGNVTGNPQLRITIDGRWLAEIV